MGSKGVWAAGSMYCRGRNNYHYKFKILLRYPIPKLVRESTNHKTGIGVPLVLGFC